MSATTLPKKAKAGKKHRKYNRNRIKCDLYRKTGRREKNKMRRVLRHNGPEALATYKEMLYSKIG